MKAGVVVLGNLSLGTQRANSGEYLLRFRASEASLQLESHTVSFFFNDDETDKEYRQQLQQR